MITIDTLLRLIEVRQELIKTAEKFGYDDLRFFISYNDDQRHTLNIMGTYRSGTRDDATAGEYIEKALSELLNTSAQFWGKGALGLDKYYLKEGYNAPLSDMDKIIDYFIDEIIPRSTDKEPDPEDKDRVLAKQKWEEHKKMQEDPLQGWKRKRNRNGEIQPDYAEITAKKTKDVQQNLPPETIRSVDEVLQKLGNDRQQWDALEAYIHAKRETLSGVPTPSSK